MTPEQFCYWLQGFFELGRPHKIESPQLEDIEARLDICLNHIKAQGGFSYGKLE